MRHHNIYITDYGDVRISDREAALLQRAEEAKRDIAPKWYRRWPLTPTEMQLSVIRRAEAIAVACNRVAEYKHGGDHA